jgi:hypothetical protein
MTKTTTTIKSPFGSKAPVPASAPAIVKPTIAADVAPKPKKKREYSIPAYEDTMAISARDWVGTRQCVVREHFLSTANLFSLAKLKATPIDDGVIDGMIKSITFAQGGPQRLQQRFSYPTLFDEVRKDLVVFTEEGGGLVLIMDAAMGPPPATIYAKRGGDLPIAIDSSDADKVTWMAAGFGLVDTLAVIAKLAPRFPVEARTLALLDTNASGHIMGIEDLLKEVGALKHNRLAEFARDVLVSPGSDNKTDLFNEALEAAKGLL